MRTVILLIATFAMLALVAPAVADPGAAQKIAAATSTDKLFTAAKEGDFDAQVRVGYALLGIDPIEGVKQDIPAARFWFSRAMAQREKARKIGLDTTMFRFAYDLEGGALKGRSGNAVSVKVSSAEVHEWLKLAAALGDASAGFSVANIYKTGSRSVKSDAMLAMEWHEWSARGGPVGLYGAALWHIEQGNLRRALYWRDHGQLALDRGIATVKLSPLEDKTYSFHDMMNQIAAYAMVKLAPGPLPGWRAAKGGYFAKRDGKLVHRGKGAGDNVRAGFYFENEKTGTVLSVLSAWNDKKHIDNLRRILDVPEKQAAAKGIIRVKGYPAFPIVIKGRLLGYEVLVDNWLSIRALLSEPSGTGESDGDIALKYLQYTNFSNMARVLKDHGQFYKRKDGTWIKRDSLADRITGTWQGTYVCSQGLTSADVYLHDMGNGRVGGRFWFSAHPTNPTTPPGGFSIRGRYDQKSGAFSFDPVEWISAPDGYRPGGASGTVTFGKSDKGTFRGRVGLDGCGEITLSQQ